MKKHFFFVPDVIGIIFVFLLGCGSAISSEPSQTIKAGTSSRITAPPESIVKKYKLNPFYKKYLDVNGIAVTSSDKVADEALYEVRYQISNVLAHRQDIWEAMAKSKEGTRIVVIGFKEQVSEVPEYYIADPNRAAYQNRRVRGYGSPELTSCGEENLLNYRGDRYNGENIFIHEFGHCIDNHLRVIDPNFGRKLRRTYRDAMSSGLWKDTYSASNPAEYWAEGVQAYFDCCRRSRTGKADGVHNQVGNREELIAYDPNLAKLVDDTLKSVEWRYTKYTDRHPAQVSKAGNEQIPEDKVIAIPKTIIDKFKIDPNFYKKMISAKGIPITCSAKVADAALLQADELASKLLAGRPDVLQAMVNGNYRLIIIGANEEVSEVPEYYTSDPVRSAYQNERVRGYGGTTTSFGEENLLCLPIDRYDDESIMIHEFGGHCVDSALRSIDPNFSRKLRQLYRDATQRGLWKNTYAGSNPGEYWAEAVQDYFDCNRRNNWNHTWVHTREELQKYDPNMCKFVGETFNLTPGQDWRYKWLAKQPAVTTPPAKLQADAFYKKYVYCRSLPIMGSEKASDEAMLKANEIIRNMFTYRHDILKAMIDQGLRVVVLADDEDTRNVPECALLSYAQRCLMITKPQFRIVIGQDYILTPEKYGENLLVKEFAKAICTKVATRPFDPNFEKSRNKQQYELYGVERVDERFMKKLVELYNNAMNKGLLNKTAPSMNPVEYFAEGVQSWFDCNGENKLTGVKTRAELQAKDPDLAAFIADTFKHTQREGFDWRCPIVVDEKKKVVRDYLEKLNNRTKGLESYQCKLEYLFEQPVFETKTLQKGDLYYLKEDAKSFLRINFATRKEEEEKEQKYQDEYIFDGIWLTHIDYQVKEVKRYQRAKEVEPVDAFELVAKNFPILGFSKIEELEKNYDIKMLEQKGGNEKFVVLSLSPKPDSEYKDYKTIDLWVDSSIDLPAKIIATNADGDIYQVRFVEPKVNQKIDKKIFEYKIPKGFTVETNKLDEENK